MGVRLLRPSKESSSSLLQVNFAEIFAHWNKIFHWNSPHAPLYLHPYLDRPIWGSKMENFIYDHGTSCDTNRKGGWIYSSRFVRGRKLADGIRL